MQALHPWYGELTFPVGWSAQPTLHEHAERERLTFTRTVEKSKQMVWVKNEAGKEFAMCCYLKNNVCNFIVEKPDRKKKGRLSSALSRHAHLFSSCGCVALPLNSRKKGIRCVRCTERDTKDLQRDEALRLDLMVRGEDLNRREDNLRLQQRELDEIKRTHEKAQTQLFINVATSCQRSTRTRRFVNPAAEKKRQRIVSPVACTRAMSAVIAASGVDISMLQVEYTGKDVGTGGQTTGVKAGRVEFGTSGMTIPVVVKQYDLDNTSSVVALKQELAALTSMKKSRSVVKLIGMCAEGLVLEPLPLDLRDLFQASHKRNDRDYQVHYLLESRPISTGVNARKFIVKVCLLL
jgi:hypothetical protein